jgi:hypothetical protein
MDMLKAKINSNLAHKPKKGLLMDEFQLRQNEFLLQLQGIYALHCSFAILFYYYFVFCSAPLSLFLFSFFYSAPLSRGCQSSISVRRRNPSHIATTIVAIELRHKQISDDKASKSQ